MSYFPPSTQVLVRLCALQRICPAGGRSGAGGASLAEGGVRGRGIFIRLFEKDDILKKRWEPYIAFNF